MGFLREKNHTEEYHKINAFQRVRVDGIQNPSEIRRGICSDTEKTSASRLMP